MRTASLLALLLCAALSGCQGRGSGEAGQPGAGENATPEAGAAAKLDKVTLQLNWFPEAEHGGYYAAEVAGIFKRHHLEVTILPGGVDTKVVQQVANGSVTFGVSNADNVLFGRAQDAPIVAVMAPLQTSPRCIMVHASAGIHGFDDLHDMTLAMSNSLAFSFYLRKKVPLHNVRIIPYTGSVVPFLTDPKFGQQGYVFSEPFVARQQGADPQVLMLADLGFNPYTSLLITSENEIHDHPDIVRRMVAASVEGWQHYIEQPEAANALIHQLNPQMDLDVLAFGAAAIKPLVIGETPAANDKSSPAGAAPPPLGSMTRARWQELTDQLIYCEQLKPGEVQVDGAFSTEFLPK